MRQGTQVDLWDQPDSVTAVQAFRPIHYLGSKLRLVNEICSAVDALDRDQRPVCDLFSGSGTVAWALSRTRSVTAVDIQEYSRVLCSALLPNEPPSREALMAVAMAGSESPRSDLARAFEPMIEYEALSLREAASGRPDMLCEVLDKGSLFSFQKEQHCASTSKGLRGALKATSVRLVSAGLDECVESLVTRYYGGIYFSYSQAVGLDSMLGAAESRTIFSSRLCVRRRPEYG
jgi:hypothetical protein